MIPELIGAFLLSLFGRGPKETAAPPAPAPRAPTQLTYTGPAPAQAAPANQPVNTAASYGVGFIPPAGPGEISEVILPPPLQFSIPSGANLTPAQYDMLAQVRTDATGAVWEAAGFKYVYWNKYPHYGAGGGYSEGPFESLEPPVWPDSTKYASIYNAANQAGRDAQRALLRTWGITA